MSVTGGSCASSRSGARGGGDVAVAGDVDDHLARMAERPALFSTMTPFDGAVFDESLHDGGVQQQPDARPPGAWSRACA